MESEHDWLRETSRPGENVDELLSLAAKLEIDGDFHTAATALDRAFGLNPGNVAIRSTRQRLLDQLSLVEHGIVFRYIPAGSFLMGSEDGDADERPIHPVQLTHYWISETPISWARYCELMNWELPPVGMPKNFKQKSMSNDRSQFTLIINNQIRLQYCEDETLHAADWHTHMPPSLWKTETGQVASSRKIFGQPARAHPEKPWGYDAKPMVCAQWDDVQRLCERLSSSENPQKLREKKSWLPRFFGKRKLSDVKESSAPGVEYRLPTEAEWEKAARGGLVGCRYPWGNDAPNRENCDFSRFDQFSILPMKRYPSNDYGLYAMSGCVWEWTADFYDAEYYHQSPSPDPQGPENGKCRVVRGGSWADCAEAATVSFRMALGEENSLNARNANTGFRLCRVPAGSK